MAKKLLGPWSVLYGVKFYSGGDTTRQAFGKHIQEITRIYGLLNALDAGKAGSEEIAEAVQSLQHNSLRGLQGGSSTERYHLTNAQVTKLNGAASASDVVKNHNSLQGLQGGDASNRYHLTAAQVAKLEGAASSGDVVKNHNSLQGLQGGDANNRWHLTAAQVNGLTNLINNPPKAFTDESILENGYASFANGLVLQWGRQNVTQQYIAETAASVRFPKTFPAQCFTVIAVGEVSALYSGETLQHKDVKLVVGGKTTTGFTIHLNWGEDKYTDRSVFVDWLALGK